MANFTVESAIHNSLVLFDKNWWQILIISFAIILVSSFLFFVSFNTPIPFDILAIKLGRPGVTLSYILSGIKFGLIFGFLSIVWFKLFFEYVKNGNLSLKNFVFTRKLFKKVFYFLFAIAFLWHLSYIDSAFYFLIRISIGFLVILPCASFIIIGFIDGGNVFGSIKQGCLFYARNVVKIATILFLLMLTIAVLTLVIVGPFFGMPFFAIIMIYMYLRLKYGRTYVDALPKAIGTNETQEYEIT